MTVMGYYIGYVECDNCNSFVHIINPNSMVIWFHPDDPRPLCEATCPKCSYKVVSRIDYEHMVNFRKRGVNVKPFGDKFPELTEEEINEWDIDAELASLV